MPWPVLNCFDPFFYSIFDSPLVNLNKFPKSSTVVNFTWQEEINKDVNLFSCCPDGSTIHILYRFSNPRNEIGFLGVISIVLSLLQIPQSIEELKYRHSKVYVCERNIRFTTFTVEAIFYIYYFELSQRREIQKFYKSNLKVFWKECGYHYLGKQPFLTKLATLYEEQHMHCTININRQYSTLINHSHFCNLLSFSFSPSVYICLN